MNSSVSAIPSGFWLPEPAVEVGWEKPKTKPVRTDAEARLWHNRPQPAEAKKSWIDALIYSAFVGSSTVSAGYALRSLHELFANDSRTNTEKKFFE
jgi:1,4-alpha-glucan branching enzyme